MSTRHPAAPEPTADNTVVLRAPLVMGSQRYTELTFRTPKGADLCASGYPFKLSRAEDGEVVRIFEPVAITALISRLAGVPTSVAKELSLPDWNECMAVISGFFGDPSSPGPVE